VLSQRALIKALGITRVHNLHKFLGRKELFGLVPSSLSASTKTPDRFVPPRSGNPAFLNEVTVRPNVPRMPVFANSHELQQLIWYN